jgi:hypothetical protein
VEKMKIYVNEFHQIEAVRENNTGDDTLKEIEVPDDFLQPFCATVIKGFCYQINEDGSTMVYPYKDFELLMSIQQLHEEKEKQVTELQLALAEMYEERQV